MPSRSLITSAADRVPEAADHEPDGVRSKDEPAHHDHEHRQDEAAVHVTPEQDGKPNERGDAEAPGNSAPGETTGDESSSSEIV